MRRGWAWAVMVMAAAWLGASGHADPDGPFLDVASPRPGRVIAVGLGGLAAATGLDRRSTPPTEAPLPPFVAAGAAPTPSEPQTAAAGSPSASRRPAEMGAAAAFAL